MTLQNNPSQYDAFYFKHCCGKPYERTQEWLQFFTGIADAIVRRINPQTVLDVGCAMGFLVEGLRERGVDAYGIDVSEYVIQRVRSDLQPYCRVGSVLDPLPQRYDLIVSIEVLEHLPSASCEQAVRNLCVSTDDILFSSTPHDYREPSHLNVQPPEYWAEFFAINGFVRDLDFDASFITPWAARFRKTQEPLHRVVREYERRVWALSKENQDLRGMAIEMRDQLAAKESSPTDDDLSAQQPSAEEKIKAASTASSVPIIQEKNAPAISAQTVEHKPVLVISHEIIGAKMAGPGIRYYQLARVLAREFPVVLAAPTGSISVQTSSIEPSMLVYASGQDAALEKAIGKARAILVPAVMFTQMPALLHTDAPIIIDGYDPFLAETLYLTTETQTQQAALTQAYLAGDFFMCASERQRDWWLGVLEVLGRVNAQAFAEDNSLRKLVDLVPFGLSELPPQHTRQMVKGIIPGIGENDRVVLWGGGLWQWLDPLTAIRAISKITEQRQDVRLYFPGTRHPNPTMAGLATQYPAAYNLANQLGLLDKFVFFGEWVSYDDWQNVLLESDVALTLHQNDTLESRLAFRSRMFDYLWASLPVVATRGDAISELIAANDIGLLVDGQDVDGVARAIVRLIDTPRSAFAEKFRIIHQTMTWERAALPLTEFCRRPSRAPDKGALGDRLGNPYYVEKIAQLQSEGTRLQNLVGTYEQRRMVRLLNRVVEFKKRLD